MHHIQHINKTFAEDKIKTETIFGLWEGVTNFGSQNLWVKTPTGYAEISQELSDRIFEDSLNSFKPDTLQKAFKRIYAKSLNDFLNKKSTIHPREHIHAFISAEEKQQSIA